MDDPDKLLLSLKSWPSPDTTVGSVAALIPRIQIERGSFRDTTEELLEGEIAALQAGLIDGRAAGRDDVHNEEIVLQAPSGAGKPLDDKERVEMLARGRKEILTEIQWVPTAPSMSVRDRLKALQNGTA